nr:TauD/TfdA family dioxygenase [Pseudomarimonas arenosa]
MSQRPWPAAHDWRDGATWLRTLLECGAVRLPGVPIEPNHCGLHRVAALLGPPSLRAVSRQPDLNQGRGVQSVRALAQPIGNRFGETLRSSGSEAFPLHTDEAFLERPCRWVLLHCWQADPDGRGASVLADLRQLALADRPTLTRPLPYRCGMHVTLPEGAPARFNPEALQSPLNDGDLQAVDRIAAALAAQSVRFLLQQGELLVIDNWRLAHGREAFSPESSRLLLRLRLLG